MEKCVFVLFLIVLSAFNSQLVRFKNIIAGNILGLIFVDISDFNLLARLPHDHYLFTTKLNSKILDTLKH